MPGYLKLDQIDIHFSKVGIELLIKLSTMSSVIMVILIDDLSIDQLFHQHILLFQDQN